jgi:hypothetical protein
LDKVVEWSKEWLMLFDVDKSRVMHLGYGNVKAEYKMNEICLQAVSEEVDLGVIVQNDFKCAMQCAKVMGEANREMGLIKWTFLKFSADIVVN